MYLGIGATRTTKFALLHAFPSCSQFAKIFLTACGGAAEREPGMW
jgi:hypothetical protein